MKYFSEELLDSKIDQTILQVDETMSSIDLVLKDVNSGRGSLGKFIKDGDFYIAQKLYVTTIHIWCIEHLEHAGLLY